MHQMISQIYRRTPYISVDSCRIFQSMTSLLECCYLLARTLPNHGILVVKLKSSLRQLYGLHYDLVNRYGIDVSYPTTDMFSLS